MKGVARAFAQSVLSTAGITVLLLVANVALVLWFFTANSEYAQQERLISSISDGLVPSAEGYAISTDAQAQMGERDYMWGMLLDHEGNVVWQQSLPEDLNRRYTVDDVARFTKWYLEDNPVDVWARSDGLLVLGGAKDSTWKINVKYPMPLVNRMLDLAKAAVALNIALAVLLALLVHLRQYRAIRLLAGGITRLADSEPATLPERGSLKELARKVNSVSDTLQAQRAALDRRDSARTNWISGVSHDIRTPLSMILGNASEMAEDAALPVPVRDKCAAIQVHSLRIRELIADLNLASKLEYDMQPMKRKPVQLGALARRVAADCLNAGLDERYTVDLDIQECSVLGDEALLQRALTNLLQNAIRHNPNGAHITICVNCLGNKALMKVRDEGVGVDASTLDALNATNPSLSGSDASAPRHGLGLLIVGQIARAHGGRVEYASPDGSGFDATILLPDQ